MDELNTNRTPIGGIRIIWYAMDKNGYIASFNNNAQGSAPNILLDFDNAETWLDHTTDYLFQESKVYNTYPPSKNGSNELDMYSSNMFWHCRSRFLGEERSRKNVEKHMQKEILMMQTGGRVLSEYDWPRSSGIFIYEALWTYRHESDKPIGYDGESKDGDYFRFLMPTIYASIEDLPQDLRKIVVVSDTVDFTKDRFFKNEMIDTYFTHMYEG